MVYIALLENSQEEFIENGNIDYGYTITLFSCWFLPILIILELISYMIFKMLTWEGEK